MSVALDPGTSFGGELPPKTIDGLHITDDEISEFRFCTSNEARELLRPYVWKRSAAALAALAGGHVRYRHRDDEPG